ncbi:hypothetical protein BJY00DRAFT_278793 [Aspergillus carlsbadensis]|nr:hypothetical protein BJY00DRAFT_278793 [Aspergillus carlsbadensis]
MGSALITTQFETTAPIVRSWKAMRSRLYRGTASWSCATACWVVILVLVPPPRTRG